AICDVNGDGHPDLVVADGSVTGGNLIVIPQDPSNPGHFLAATKVAAAPTYTGQSVANPAYGIACGNLNGDGHSMDVVMTSFATNASDNSTISASGTISIYPHDPAHPGSFLPRIDIPVQGLLHRVVIADLNHDGLPDIVVSNEGPYESPDQLGTAGVVVLLQNASQPGTFAAPVTYAADPAISVAVGDINGDGLPDLVIASPSSFSTDAIQVLLNDGSNPGTFGVPNDCGGSGTTACAALGNPVSVAIGDLNGDGLPDIATADGTGAVVMFQSPSAPGTFETATQVGS
ncbi:MAG: FG-GAP repeat domain-containing protein, partial [Steroidobacteraceae bacterium]